MGVGAGKLIWTILVPPKNCVAWRVTIFFIRPSRDLSLIITSADCGVTDVGTSPGVCRCTDNGTGVEVMIGNASTVEVAASTLRPSSDAAGYGGLASMARLESSSAATSSLTKVAKEFACVSRSLTYLWDAGLVSGQ